MNLPETWRWAAESRGTLYISTTSSVSADLLLWWWITSTSWSRRNINDSCGWWLWRRTNYWAVWRRSRWSRWWSGLWWLRDWWWRWAAPATSSASIANAINGLAASDRCSISATSDIWARIWINCDRTLRNLTSISEIGDEEIWSVVESNSRWRPSRAFLNSHTRTICIHFSISHFIVPDPSQCSVPQGSIWWNSVRDFGILDWTTTNEGVQDIECLLSIKWQSNLATSTVVVGSSRKLDWSLLTRLERLDWWSAGAWAWPLSSRDGWRDVVILALCVWILRSIVRRWRGDV